MKKHEPLCPSFSVQCFRRRVIDVNAEKIKNRTMHDARRACVPAAACCGMEDGFDCRNHSVPTV